MVSHHNLEEPVRYRSFATCKPRSHSLHTGSKTACYVNKLQALWELQGDVSAILAEARSRASAAQPNVPWQSPLYSKSSRYCQQPAQRGLCWLLSPTTKQNAHACSAAGNFAIHGQSVRQVQVRTPSFSSSNRALKHSQSAGPSAIKVRVCTCVLFCGSLYGIVEADEQLNCSLL